MAKVVIITGAASGIGQATVKKYLTEKKFNVVAIDCNQDRLYEFYDSLVSSHKKRLSLLILDLVDDKSCATAFDQLIGRYQAIDHIVVSHSIGYDNGVSDNDKWDKIIDTNLHATQRLFSHLADVIVDGGRVVVVSSILGRVGKVNNSGYVASKHGLLGLTKALALDFAPRKITVNAVLPAWVKTPMMLDELDKQAALLGVPTKKLLRTIKKKIPLRKLIKPEDVANSILFLTSADAGMITAQSIVIDGGFGCGV